MHARRRGYDTTIPRYHDTTIPIYSSYKNGSSSGVRASGFAEWFRPSSFARLRSEPMGRNGVPVPQVCDHHRSVESCRCGHVTVNVHECNECATNAVNAKNSKELQRIPNRPKGGVLWGG